MTSFYKPSRFLLGSVGLSAVLLLGPLMATPAARTASSTSNRLADTPLEMGGAGDCGSKLVSAVNNGRCFDDSADDDDSDQSGLIGLTAGDSNLTIYFVPSFDPLPSCNFLLPIWGKFSLHSPRDPPSQVDRF